MIRVACGGLLVLVAFVVGCSARGTPRVDGADELGAANEALAEGCYACLREALDRYEQLLAKSRSRPQATDGAFAAALLVALREKELGLPFTPAMDRARQLASAQADPALANTLVDLAQQVRGELAGIDPEERAERMRLRRGPPPRMDASLMSASASPTGSLAIRYLWLTLECEHPEARRALKADEVTARLGDTPLIRYRLARCTDETLAWFQSLRARDARWTELSFFEGRALIGDPRTIAQGIDALRAAHDALNDSTAVTMTLADAERAARETEAALGHYDLVLTSSPTHRDALLGRAFALTHLQRHTEGVSAATALIDLGTWHLADAHYLRAWNEYQLKRLDEAWADIERATSLRSSTDVFMLAGLVAYARQDLDTARERFERAYVLDRSNCAAEQYLGIVLAEQQKWAVAAPVFSTAMSCFADAATRARAELAQIESADTPPDFKAREAATRRELIADSDLQAARCSYNAAQAYARVGLRQQALDHLPPALAHDEVRQQAEKLRVLLQQ